MIEVKCIQCGKGILAKPSRIARGLSKFCSMLCFNEYRKTPAIRFWRYVTKTPTCWLWRGCLDSKGYGHILNNISAHRYSYTLHKGLIPIGLQVRHQCDNPICVNPNHLLLGTHLDNMMDKVERGQTLKGSRNPKSRLYREAVDRIRSSTIPAASMAQIYHVCKSTIYRLRRGEPWG